jgi:hypothetical protein
LCKAFLNNRLLIILLIIIDYTTSLYYLIILLLIILLVQWSYGTLTKIKTSSATRLDVTGVYYGCDRCILWLPSPIFSSYLGGTYMPKSDILCFGKITFIFAMNPLVHVVRREVAEFTSQFISVKIPDGCNLYLGFF